MCRSSSSTPTGAADRRPPPESEDDLSQPGDVSAPGRDWNAAPNVVRARALLARNRFGGAVREAWKAANIAVRAGDERGCAVVLDLAREIGERSSGRAQRNAAVLSGYLSHCLDDSGEGMWRGSPVARLLGFGRKRKTKPCPDCAETIKAAARVCRFCGHRL